MEKIREAKDRSKEPAKQAAEALRQRRAEEENESQEGSKKRRGEAPAEPSEIPKDKARSKFTDPDLKIITQKNEC
ncbi:MAG: hypothetical protein ACFCD0_13605 [Gemmataceae bacterium]